MVLVHKAITVIDCLLVRVVLTVTVTANNITVIGGQYFADKLDHVDGTLTAKFFTAR